MILLGAFILKLTIFHISISFLERKTTPPSLLRSALVNVGIGVVMAEGVPQIILRLPPHLLEYQVFLTGGLLFVAAILLSRMVCDIRWISAFAGGILLGVLTLTFDHFVPMLAARFIPEGSSFADFRSRTDAAMAKARAAADKQAASQVKQAKKGAGVMRKGLDALATLTTKSEQEAFRQDLSRGFEMYTERKRLMEAMTPEEKAEYQAQMADFMKECNLDTNMYSMAKVGVVSTNDISTLVTALKDFQQANPAGPVADNTAGMRTIAGSLATITSNLTTISLSEKDMALMERFATLFGSNELDQAVAEAKADFVASGGSNAVSFALLAAVSKMQKESTNVSPQAFVGPLSVSTNAAALVSAPTATVKRVEHRPPPPPPPPRPKPVDPRFVITRVPYTMGDVLFPGLVSNRAPWVKAACEMHIKGYMKFHGQTAALLVEGGVLMPGDEWTSAEGGGECTFTVESIEDGRVNLRVPAK